VQGAAEWVLQKCTHCLNSEGLVDEMTEEQRNVLTETITDMASRGLRTLCLAYTDLPFEDDSRPADFFDSPHEESLVATCIVGIKVW
jgi:Ca2+-transporting ATPase